MNKEEKRKTELGGRIIIHKYKVTDLMKPCVYSLLKDKKIVYIGSSRNGLYRALSHHKNKDFDEIGIVDYNDEDLKEGEAEYILEYKPFYNKVIPPNRQYITLNQFKKRFCKKNSFTIWTLKRIIKKYNIRSEGTFRDLNYYSLKKLYDIVFENGRDIWKV